MSAEPTDFVPLPHLACHVLLALRNDVKHGWAIVRRIEELTQGMWSPSAGSLYLSMTRLEEQGLIEEAPAPEADADARRRYYGLTRLGRRVLDVEMHRLASLVAAAETVGEGRGPSQGRPR